MNRGLLYLLFSVLLAVGCNRAPENREAVREGVIEHLKTVVGLDLDKVNVELKTVEFAGGEAKANIAVASKEAPSQGMSIAYTLERKDNKWVVKGRSGHGAGMMPPGGGMDLPPAQPPAAAPGGELPAGHPPVNAPAPQTK